MFPSGVWEGFWEQGNLGKQPMTQFEVDRFRHANRRQRRGTSASSR